MLSGSGFGNYAPLPHISSQQNLADGIVDFVSTCVVKVFTFQIQPATIALAHATGIIQWRWPPGIVAQQCMELFLEFRTFYYRFVTGS